MLNPSENGMHNMEYTDLPEITLTPEEFIPKYLDWSNGKIHIAEFDGLKNSKSLKKIIESIVAQLEGANKYSGIKRHFIRNKDIDFITISCDHTYAYKNLALILSEINKNNLMLWTCTGVDYPGSIVGNWYRISNMYKINKNIEITKIIL
jgi:hypothetical protein